MANMASKSVSKSGGGDRVEKSGGPSRAPSRETEREPTYFEQVTGRSPAMRQAWRDNFNGGAPAGDLTGNIPQGDGSSGAPPYRGSVGAGYVASPGGAATAGAGNPGAGTGKPVAGPGSAGVKPSGGSLTMGAGGPIALTRAAPLQQGRKDKATGGVVFGLEWLAWPGSSNVEDFWETRYGEPGEFVGGIVNMPLDIGYNVGKGARRLADHIGAMGDQGLIQEVGRGPGNLGAISDWYHSFDYTPTPSRGGYTGFVTGGGF